MQTAEAVVVQALDVDAPVIFGMELVGGHSGVQVEVGVREVAYLIAGQSPGDQGLGLATLLDSPENVRTSVEMACRHDEKDGDEDEGRARDHGLQIPPRVSASPSRRGHL